MKRNLLFLLIFILYAADTLNLDLSLAPGLSVKNAILYSVFAAILIEAAVTRKYRVELVPVLLPMLLFTAYAVFMWVVTVMVIDYPGYSLRASLFSLKGGPVDHMIVMLVFFYGVASLRDGLWLLRAILWIVILGNLITVLEGLDILNFGLIGAKEDGRVVGPIGNANLFGYLLAFMLPIIVGMYWSARGVSRVLAGLGIFITALAFLMAVSRGAIVGLIAGAALGFFVLRKSIPMTQAAKVVVALVVGSVVLLAIAAYGGYLDLLVDRFRQFEEGGVRASSGRTVFWSMLVNRMLEDPVTFITGFGWHAYSTFRKQNVFGFDAHSTYLTILFNLGLIGLTLFLAVLVNSLRIARSGAAQAEPAARYHLNGFLFGQSALLIALVFNDLYGAWLYIWPVIGICMRMAVSAPAITASASETLTKPRAPRAGPVRDAGGYAEP